ncbi:ABC transporter permease subunit, partial [Acinetobacter baumannii]
AGVAIGVPLGIFMGRFDLVRQLLDPYIEFFRFIPPIAFVTLAVIWLGPGELSKIALIFYTTVFIVTLNTIAGVQAVNPLR